MKKNRKNLFFLLIKILLITFILLFGYKYVFGFYIVKNNDLKSINIKPHDFLIFYKYNNEYENDDIVFYKNNVYKVVGTFDQVINKVRNKTMIDNSVIDEIQYNYNYPYSIQRDEVFLLNNKDDSRIFGCVKIKDIEGKLIFRMQIRDF